ncbi:MAG: response regulator [Acetobacteraceae bacterium]|nr:response regulator [Acetobacteraceae bacterium]
MSRSKIRLLVVEDSAQMRETLRKMLEFEPDFELVGEAADGADAVAMASRLLPDVILMDIHMPGKDGITATSEILRAHPAGVIVISVEGQPDYLRRAMQAGARDFLVKPFSGQELAEAVRRAYRAADAARVPAGRRRPGTVVTVFGTKGGVGRSTLAANLAVVLAREQDRPVAAVDFDLEFGSMAALLGVKPQASVVDLCRGEGPPARDLLEKVLTPTAFKVALLAAPPSPDLAAEVDGEGKRERDRNYASEVLELLQEAFDFVVVDTASNFREATLAALDHSRVVLLVTTPDLTALQNTGKALDVLLERLEYPRDRLRLVLNRADEAVGITRADIAQGLDFPVSFCLPAEARTVVWAANCGRPFATYRRETGVVKAVKQVARAVLELGAQGDPGDAAEPPAGQGYAAAPLPTPGRARDRRPWTLAAGR